MKRITLILLALGMVLLVVTFFVLVFQPAREELAAVEEQIELELDAQRVLQAEIARLEAVREDAPGVEADLAVADAIVPRDPAIPALIRQLQHAADESGMTLITVSTTRPSEVPDTQADGLFSLAITSQLEGGYFQAVDFLRRVEDPAITPRGILWSNATVSRADGSYPELSISLTGSAFAVLATAGEPEPEPVIPDSDDDETDGTESDADLEADLDEEAGP